MKRYLLDTGPISSYLSGRPDAQRLIGPWLEADEVNTSIVVCGEVIEYLLRFPDFFERRLALMGVLEDIKPIGLSFEIVERYARLRRRLRPPYGKGLIGDMDTLIAATALEHNLAVVTMDSDFDRVPDRSVHRIVIR